MQSKDQAIESIGLPSRERYNRLVAEALDNLKAGGDPLAAQVYARLAQAEATLLTELSEPISVTVSDL